MASPPANGYFCPPLPSSLLFNYINTIIQRKNEEYKHIFSKVDRLVRKWRKDTLAHQYKVKRLITTGIMKMSVPYFACIFVLMY
jgi:hypothetical protein